MVLQGNPRKHTIFGTTCAENLRKSAESGLFHGFLTRQELKYATGFSHITAFFAKCSTA
jgi:hypothetical protein